jgi:hypothetical protein
MVLTNAERQARYKLRLKQAAARGVTPEMIEKAGRLVYADMAADRRERLPEWAEWRRTSGKKYWLGLLPDDPDADYSEYGENEGLMKAVAAVVRAVKTVPDV